MTANSFATGIKREPCFTITDLAQSVGVNPVTLARRFAASDYKPGIKLQHGTKSYYEISDLMQWVEQYNELHPDKAMIIK